MSITPFDYNPETDWYNFLDDSTLDDRARKKGVYTNECFMCANTFQGLKGDRYCKRCFERLAPNEE